MRNRWTRNRIDYHPCITSEPTNQVTDYQNDRLGVSILDYKGVNEINIRLGKKHPAGLLRHPTGYLKRPVECFSYKPASNVLFSHGSFFFANESFLR